MSSNNYVKFLHSESIIEAEQIIDYLHANRISAYIQKNIIDIYMGDSLEGADIFVLETEIQLAKDLLKEFQPIKTRSTRNNRICNDNKSKFMWILVALMIAVILVPIIFIL